MLTAQAEEARLLAEVATQVNPKKLMLAIRDLCLLLEQKRTLKTKIIIVS